MKPIGGKPSQKENETIASQPWQKIFWPATGAADCPRPRDENGSGSVTEIVMVIVIVNVIVNGIATVTLAATGKGNETETADEGALGRDTTWEGGLKDMDAESDSGDEDGELNPHECTPTEVPSKNFPKGTVFTQVAAGDSCSFVLTQTGSVYGWGSFRVGDTDIL